MMTTTIHDGNRHDSDAHFSTEAEILVQTCWKTVGLKFLVPPGFSLVVSGVPTHVQTTLKNTEPLSFQHPSLSKQF